MPFLEAKLLNDYFSFLNFSVVSPCYCLCCRWRS